MNTVDVCIRGAGPVGACLALALARRGLHVQLVGAADAAAAAGDVRAYAVNAASRDLLQQLKVWDALPADAVTAVHDMQVRGDAPGAGIDFSAWTQGVDALAWIVDASALSSALHTAVSFAPQIRATGSSPAADAHLLVLAEGRDAPARAALGVSVNRRPYAHSALATRLVGEWPHANRAHQWFTGDAVLALLPMGRPEPGRSWALIWSQAPAAAAHWQAASPGEFEAAVASAVGAEVGALRLAGDRVAWPLVLLMARPLTGPGWALVGDAAHVVHPLAGQGLNLGLADVVALDRVIASREPWRELGDAALLARYARARVEDNWSMATVTDGLLHLFEHPSPVVRSLRNAGMSLVNRLGPLKRRLATHAAGFPVVPRAR